MVTGAYRFLHDLEPEGMWHARVVRPPHGRARLRAVDLGCLPDGLVAVRDGSFLAVAGPSEWPVLRAAQRLARGCDWDLREGLEEGDIQALLRVEPTARLPVIDGQPVLAPVPPALQAPDYSASFARPYTMHGALAPSAALAEWRDDGVIIHSHSQGIYPLRDSIARSLGLPLEKVVIVHAPGSGCYGHNGADDAAYEAALIAQALPERPILLKWTREDEHAFEPYGPAMIVDTAATLTPDGTVAQWSAEVRGDTHRGRPRPGPDDAGPKRLLANALRAQPCDAFVPEANMGRHAGNHRNLDPVYAFPQRRLVKALVTGLPLRTSALRCLGAAVNILALESAMDELAAQAGADPIAYRRRQLDDPRAIAVLDRLAEKTSEAPPEGQARGIAYAQYKNTMTRVGIAVDLSVTDTALIRLHRAVIVADAGRIVDADGLSAQLEGGFLQAASWALHEEVRWDRDGIQSRDWDSYPVLRFDNVPDLLVELIDRPDQSSVGAGEASPPPALAAIANAVHAATGLRLRRLPFTPEALTAAALAE
jgi:CO/xanthine dehydrogenase Mo-binding subunit